MLNHLLELNCYQNRFPMKSIDSRTQLAPTFDVVICSPFNMSLEGFARKYFTIVLIACEWVFVVDAYQDAIFILNIFLLSPPCDQSVQILQHNCLKFKFFFVTLRFNWYFQSLEKRVKNVKIIDAIVFTSVFKLRDCDCIIFLSRVGMRSYSCT